MHQMLSELQRVHRCGDMPLQARNCTLIANIAGGTITTILRGVSQISP